MIARVDVLASLDAAWAQAQEGQPRLVTLQGEAGIGKSWLAATWRERRPGLEGRQVWTLRQAAWLPELLERGFSWFREERDPAFLGAARRLAPHLSWPALAAESDAPTSASQATLQVAGAALRLAGRLGGLALVLEDVHDWDSAQQGALTILWRRAVATTSPLLVLLTARPGLDAAWVAGLSREAELYGVSTPGARTAALWRLGPLSSQDAAELCRALLGGAAVPEELPGYLEARCGGHPLHTVQLLRYLLDSGALRQAGPVWILNPGDEAPPDRLQPLLRINLAALQADPDAWAVAGALAVVEAGAPAQEVAGVLGWATGRVQEEVNAGLARGHLAQHHGGGAPRFSLAHPLMPAVIRAQLSGPVRRELQGRAAELTPNADERARLARLGGHPQASHWTQAALEVAQARFDWPQVEAHARALLDMQPGPPDEDLTLELARALYAQGRARDAEPLLRSLGSGSSGEPRLLWAQVLRALARPAEALEVLDGAHGQDDTALGSEATLLRAGLLIETGEREQAHTVLDSILEGAALPPGARALALGELGRLDYLVGRYEGARQLNIQAVALLEGAGPAHAEQLSLCLNRVGMLSTQLGRWAEAEPALRRSIALQEGVGSFAAMAARHNNLGLLFNQLGRYAEAKVTLQRALRLAEASGERNIEVDALHNLSLSLFGLGEFSPSLEVLRRCAALGSELGQATMAAGLQHYLYDRLARLGTPEPGLAALGSGELPLDAYLGAARILLCAAQPQAAWDWLERGGVSNDSGQVAAALLRALCALLLGTLQTGAEIERAVQRSGEHPSPALRAEAQLMVALHRRQQGEPGARALAAPALEVLRSVPGHLLIYQRTLPEALLELCGPENTPARAPREAAFLRTLGDFGLEVGGQLRPWRARKLRELLALLLAAALGDQSAGLHRLALRVALWPDAADDQAEESLRVTVRRLRAALDGAATLNSQAGTYHLSLHRADVTEFLHALNHGDLDSAVACYGGEFLPHVDEASVNAVRDQLRARHRAAALSLARQSDPERGARLYDRVLREHPLDLETHLARLEVLDRAGQRAALRAALSSSVRTFEAELGEVPPELAAWVGRRAPQLGAQNAVSDRSLT